mgnify:CR=1 FL=1
MKKRILLTSLLALTLLCSTACGRRMNSATDGTNKNDTIMEDNTTTTDRNDGVIDGVVNGAEDTVDGVVDGVEDVIDGTKNTLDNTTNDGNVNENVLPDNNDNVVNDQHNVNDERRMTTRP